VFPLQFLSSRTGGRPQRELEKGNEISFFSKMRCEIDGLRHYGYEFPPWGDPG
jgi:hypothetical protein